MHTQKNFTFPLSRLILLAFAALALSFGFATLAAPAQAMAATSISNKAGLEKFITQNGGTYDSPDSSTVRLTSDLTCTDYLITYLNENLTLDLNDHSISFQKANGFSIRSSGIVFDDGTSPIFHIINSGKSAEKAVISTSGHYANTQEITTVNIAGKAELANIAICNQATGGSGNPMAVQQSVKGSELTITDCQITSTGSCYYMLYGTASFRNCHAISSGKYATVQLENQGALTLYSGSYTQNAAAPAITVKGASPEGNATLHILSGQYQGAPALSITGTHALTGISGGTFTTTDSALVPITLAADVPAVDWQYDSSKYSLTKTDTTWSVTKNETENPEVKPEVKPSKPVTPAKPKIISAKPKIAKLTPKKRALAIKFAKKPSGYYGKKYQVCYRQKGTKKWKTFTTAKQTKTLKSLKKGKKYQVRARAYTKVNSRTYYSKWSSVKTSGKIKK